MASELHGLWPDLKFNQRKHKLDPSKRDEFLRLAAIR